MLLRDSGRVNFDFCVIPLRSWSYSVVKPTTSFRVTTCLENLEMSLN